MAAMADQEVLSALELDTIREIGSIMMGASATAFSVMVDQWVNVTVPTASLMQWEELISRYSTPCYLVRIQFEQGFRGVGQLVIAEADGRQLSQLLLGDLAGEENPTDELCLSALAEVMNQMMGAASTSLATLLNRPVSITPPRSSLVSREDLLTELQAGVAAEGELGQSVAVVFCEFHIGQEITVEMVLVLLPDLARNMVHNLWEAQGISGPDTDSAAGSEAGSANPASIAADEAARVASGGGDQPRRSETASDLGNLSIELIRHVPVEIAVRLGSTELPMDTVAHLGPGAVLELDQGLWQPVEVLANGRVIAFGQLVSVNDHYAVRITELANGRERLAAATAQPASARRRGMTNPSAVSGRYGG